MFPTHKSAHMLDLVITRSNDHIIHDIHPLDPLISDHRAILCSAPLNKPDPIQKAIQYCPLFKISPSVFIDDLFHTDLVSIRSDNQLDLTWQYDLTLTSLLDKHTPKKTKTISECTHANWHTSELGKQKSALRKLERKSNQSKLAIDADIYKTASDEYNKLLYETKVAHYNGLIAEAANNQGTLFPLVDKLLHRTSSSPLPSYDSTTDLANQFAEFFNDKIEKIYTHLSTPSPTDAPNISSPASTFPEPSPRSTLLSFTKITPQALQKFINKSPIKSCSLDPIPASLF